MGERDGRRGDVFYFVVVQPHVTDARETGEDTASNALEFVVRQVQVEEGGQLPKGRRFKGLEIIVVENLDAKYPSKLTSPRRTDTNNVA